MEVILIEEYSGKKSVIDIENNGTLSIIEIIGKLYPKWKQIKKTPSWITSNALGWLTIKGVCCFTIAEKSSCCKL
jgi:hypothetical protein